MNFFDGLRKRINGKSADTFEYTVTELNRIKSANTALAKHLGRPFNDEFRERKSSDTLFILGSGPSINELSDRDLAVMRDADSIGFNWWLAHDFVPDFYLFQFPAAEPDSLMALLKMKYDQYSNVPMIMRGTQLGKRPHELEDVIKRNFLVENVFFMNEFPIHSRCAINIHQLIEFVANLGFFTFGKIGPYTVKWRGTLGLLISFGYQMGYRRIILCGIDMNDSTHFFDTDTYNELRARINLPHPGESNIETMMNKKHSANTVGEYVAQLSRYMATKAGVELLIASEASALRDTLPLWRR